MKIILITLFIFTSCTTLFKGKPLIEEVTENRNSVDSEDIEKILHKKGSANEEYAGASVLLYAMTNVSKKHKYKVVSTLLHKGANINFSATFDKTRLEKDKKQHFSPDAMKFKEEYHPKKITLGPLVNHLIEYKKYSFTRRELTTWMNLLVRYKFNPNVRDKNGNTPLHFAVAESIRSKKPNLMTKFLIKRGGKCFAKNKKKTSPYYWAKRSKVKKLFRIFKYYCKRK